MLKRILGMNVENRKLVVYMMMAAMVILAAGQAFGFTYGTGGTASNADFMDDLYNFVNQATTGAPAYAIALIGVCVAGYCLWTQKIIACVGVFACLICISKANSILNTTGYTFS